MASPPYSYSPSSAISPPYPSHTQLPTLNTHNMTSKKRVAGDGTQAPALKRRKASVMSAASGGGSAHPLRQTSFPPDEISTPFSARSPSVDVDSASLVSGSQVSGAPPKKKRGRKPKADKARDKTPSLVGGRAATAVSGASGPKSNQGGALDGEDDDDGDGDVPETEMITARRTDEDRKKEKQLRATLVQCLDVDQYERHAVWRATKLPDSVIRRLVNQTVSQSVPGQVVTAVRSVTKYFLTEMIAKAQKVQEEWVEAEDEKQAGMEWPGKVVSRDGPEVQELYDQMSKVPRPDWEASDDIPKPEHVLKKPPKGPLRPDHLREAWRRYKASTQSYGAGTQALWHQQQHSGAERYPVRTGGRRIFK